jgi:hypothetical protein
MKTGRPGMHIPSPSTVSRDVRLVFAKTRKRIAAMLQVKHISSYRTKILTEDLQNYDGKINFATDAWTSPNHYAYVALTAHLEAKGEPISIVLDVVEVAKVCGRAITTV